MQTKENNNKTQNKDNNYEFYLKVNKNVDRILIYLKNQNTIRYVTEMQYVTKQETAVENGPKELELKLESNNDQNQIPVSKIYNGTIDKILLNKELLFSFLYNVFSTEYTFNTLFSIPITKESLQILQKEYNESNLPENTNKLIKNSIIVNTHKDFEKVVVEVPKKIQKILNLPNILILIKSNAKENTTNKLSNMEMFSKGLDPQGNNHILLVNIDITNYMINLNHSELISILDDYKFKICCYKHIVQKTLTFEK